MMNKDLGSITIESDLSDFAAQLEQASSRFTGDTVTNVVHSMGDEVAHLAQQYAPKKSGALAGSIKAVHGDRESRVVMTSPYGAYVEFGTWRYNVIRPQQGTYTIRPKRPGGVLRFTNAQGKVIYAKKVEHPGIPAQLFMTRATNEILDKFTSQVGNVGVQLVLE